MRKLIITIFFILTFLLFTGTVFAGSVPDAMSYFTNSSYNKTYTDDDGIVHTMTVTWVGETWNKVGTVIYSINFNDIYEKDGANYTVVDSSTKSYKNARPTYPDSSEHSVYRVNWYRDGSSVVIFDYRYTVSEPTPTTTPTPKPTPTPAATPTPTPTSEPNPMSTPTATPEPAPEAVVIPTSTPVITSVAMIEDEDIQETETKEDDVSSVWSVPEEDTEGLPRWIWFVILFAGIGAAISLAFYLESRRKKEEKLDENNKT